MDNPKELATQGTQGEETGNIGYTRRRNWQHRVHKTKKLATQSTQDEETGNIGYARRRKTKQNTTHYVLDITIRKETCITYIRHEPSNKQPGDMNNLYKT